MHLSIASGALKLEAPAATAAAGTSTVRLRLVDARGTGRGWAIRLASRTGSVAVTSVRVACAPGSTCTLPRTAVSYPVAVDASRPAAVLDALARTGMGAFDVTLTVSNTSGRPAPLALSLATS